jgi:hypothetical protein
MQAAVQRYEDQAMVCCAHSAAQPQPYALPLTLNPRAHSALRHRQAAAVDMEEEFLSLGLDIIGLGVFNFDFGSITRESPVIKARRRGPGCGRARAGAPRNNRLLHWGGLLSAAVEHLTMHPYAAANRHDAGHSSAACR